VGSHLGFRLDDGAGRRPGLETSYLCAPSSSDVVSVTPVILVQGFIFDSDFTV